MTSGKNTIDLSLPTFDYYRIGKNVYQSEDNRIKAVLSDLRDTEKMQQCPTLIDDEPLQPEDAFVLAHGDVITLGKTRIKYMKS